MVRKHPVITGLAGISAVVAVMFLVRWYRTEKKKVETKNEGKLIMPEKDEKEIKEHENEIDFKNLDKNEVVLTVADKNEVVTAEIKTEKVEITTGRWSWFSDLGNWFKSWFNKKEVKNGPMDEIDKEIEKIVETGKLEEQKNKNMENNFKLPENPNTNPIIPQIIINKNTDPNANNTINTAPNLYPNQQK